MTAWTPRNHIPAPIDIKDRIRTKIKKDHGCWLWTGALRPNGYGAIGWWHDRKAVAWLAHRVAFVAWRGQISPGKHLHHTCRNRRCVNPWHLVEVDQGAHNASHTRTLCRRGLHVMEQAAKYRKDRLGARECGECAKLRRKTRRG